MKSASKILLILGAVWFILSFLSAVSMCFTAFWVAKSASDDVIIQFFKEVLQYVPGSTNADKVAYIRMMANPFAFAMIFYAVAAIVLAILSFVALKVENSVLYIVLTVFGFIFGNVVAAIGGLLGFLVVDGKDKNKPTPAPAQ